MSGPTPGPWEIYDTTSGYVIGGEEGEVAMVHGFQDARLMAAAPDLLKAAISVRDMLADFALQGDVENHRWYAATERLREAIAKAEGR